MFCQQCGASAPEHVKFCKQCGRRLKTGISNKALLIAAIAAIVSIGTSLPLLFSSGEPTKAESSPSPTATPLPNPTPTPQITIVRATPKLQPTAEPEEEPTPTPTPRSTPQVHAYALAQGPFTLKAGSYMFYQIRFVPGASLRIEGWFEASGGSRNDIEVYILDEIGFTNFKNGNSAQAYYNSGRVTTGKSNIALPLVNQNYYLVFNNRFSLFSSKSVRTSMTAWYTDMRQR